MLHGEAATWSAARAGAGLDAASRWSRIGRDVNLRDIDAVITGDLKGIRVEVAAFPSSKRPTTSTANAPFSVGVCAAQRQFEPLAT